MTTTTGTRVETSAVNRDPAAAAAADIATMNATINRLRRNRRGLVRVARLTRAQYAVESMVDGWWSQAAAGTRRITAATQTALDVLVDGLAEPHRQAAVPVRVSATVVDSRGRFLVSYREVVPALVRTGSVG